MTSSTSPKNAAALKGAPRPTLAVVIPNYNGKHFLERCLTAVMTQDWAPDQVLVIDDKSTDGSQEKLAELQQRWPSITLKIGKENRGVVARINQALDAVTTDWVHLLAVDDTPLPGFYHLAMKQARKHPQAATLFGGFVTSEENTAERFTETADKWIEAGFLSPRRIVRKLYHKAPALFSLGYANIWRTAPLREIGGLPPEAGAYSDTVAFRCVTARHGGVYLGGSPLVCVRVSEQSFGSQVWKDREQYAKTLDLAARIMNEKCPDQFTERFLRNWRAKVVSEVGLRPWPKWRRAKHGASWAMHKLWLFTSRLLGR